ncbi:TIR domain-containing protein [Spirilliplanes yamanashiensis]|uniref:TIR domain-containing protein n=1 Tax=Spirilliplanes yamanashiensis TaxID=42233 RepID=A0A8J3Y473_9ACTN|nr:TIR domain-containing protein [Spirilliplanes yamanashiensis]MDP9820075.1 WD40 repeat protein [Spirilliplanes yamanashiensis]GIJ01104.1 hypothetical protein Sya03_04560 [Spirilliplanes yamanashiensis]
MTFNGFISYSHAADGRLAPAVQRGLHHLARPWHRRRALWIFRDQTGLAVTPTLWTSIQKALDGSEYFVLMASPEAARSPWVNKEIDHWVATKPLDRILPVVTDGEWRWDPAAGDFSADSTAVPQALRGGVFAEEPLYLDLRWARDEDQLSLRHSRFRDAIAQLAAPMHGVSKDDLEGEDVRQHRRTRRLSSLAAAALFVFALAAVLTGLLAMRNAERATDATAAAHHQEKLATEQRGNAERFAADARRYEHLTVVEQEKAKRAAAEADTQEDLARTQKARAAQASTEAERQLANARYQRALAATAAARAQEQQLRARSAVAEAREARQEARAQERNAAKQEAAAREAARDAAEQKKNAEEQERRARTAAAEAGRQEQTAVGRRLMNQAEANLAVDPQLALRLGVAADSLQPDGGLRGELANLVTTNRFAGEIDRRVAEAAHSATGLTALLENSSTVSLWQASAGAVPVQVGTVDAVSAAAPIALSRDGRTLALEEEGGVQLWDVSEPARPIRRWTLPGSEGVDRLSFSPDGRTLAVTLHLDGTALWDLSDATTAPRLRRGAAEWADARGVTFRSDGRTMVTIGDHPAVWDVSDPAGEPIRLADVGDGPLHFAAFSPTGNTLVTKAPNEMVRLWDLYSPESPVESGAINTSGESVDSISFNPTGDHLAVSTMGDTVSIYELGRTPRKVGTIDIADLARPEITPDGRLFNLDGIGVTIWNVWPLGAPRLVGPPLDVDLMVQATAFLSEGKTLAAASSSGKLTHWDATADPPRQRAEVDLPGGYVHEAAFAPDGQTLAVSTPDGRVTLLAVADPARVRTLGEFRTTTPDYLMSMTFSPDGRTLGLLGYSSIELWDVARPDRAVRLGGADGLSVTKRSHAAFSPDGRIVAIPTNVSLTLVTPNDTSTLTRLASLPYRDALVYSAAFSPDGRTLALGHGDRRVSLWDVAETDAQPSLITSLFTTRNLVESVGFSLDGNTLAASAGKKLNLWDVSKRTAPVHHPATELYPGSATGNLLRFSPDGHTLAVAGDSQMSAARVMLWDFSELNAVRVDPGRYACAVLDRGLNAREWKIFVPERPYRRTC